MLDAVFRQIETASPESPREAGGEASEGATEQPVYQRLRTLGGVRQPISSMRRISIHWLPIKCGQLSAIFSASA